MVVTVPTPLIIQGDDEQVGVFEKFQGLLTVGIGEECFTHRAAHALQDRGTQQEGLDAFGLLVKNFSQQIIQHEVMAAGESPDETGDVFSALHGAVSYTHLTLPTSDLV